MSHDRLPIASIKTHPRLQPRGGTDYRTVTRYAQAMKSGTEFPPISLARIGKNFYVVDGHHRLEAAHRAGLLTIPATSNRYVSFDEAHRAALLCNGAHGRQMTSKEKDHAFRSYIEHGLHLHGSDDLTTIPGTIKSLRTIHAECPVYSVGHIWKKLKALGINAPRDDVKPYRPNGPYDDEWGGPSEEDLAEDEAIALKTIRDRLAEAQASWALLSPTARDVASAAFREAWEAVRPDAPQIVNPNLLDI